MRRNDSAASEPSSRGEHSESGQRTSRNGGGVVQRLQRTAGNRATQRFVRDAVQRSCSGDPSESSAGRDAGQSFPHQSRIERLTGVSIPGRAITDASFENVPTSARGFREARESASLSEPPPAYTRGTTSLFKDDQPDIKTAAHEATHVAQHAGVTNDLDMGPEGHAAAVAQRVAAGESARDLIGRAGSDVPETARPYTKKKINSVQYRVSDNRDIAIPKNVSNDLGRPVQQELWATQDRIREARANIQQQNQQTINFPTLNLDQTRDTLLVPRKGLFDGTNTLHRVQLTCSIENGRQHGDSVISAVPV